MPDGYRRRRRGRHVSHERGGHVVQESTPYGKLNVFVGDRDAPSRPLSRRARVVCWIVLAVTILGSVGVLVARFA
jgi:hypothetical protein